MDESDNVETGSGPGGQSADHHIGKIAHDVDSQNTSAAVMDTLEVGMGRHQRFSVQLLGEYRYLLNAFGINIVKCLCAIMVCECCPGGWWGTGVSFFAQGWEIKS